MYEYIDVASMVGKVLARVTWDLGPDLLTFHLSDGSQYEMGHMQDCCEKVWLEDVCGDLDDLVGRPLLQAEMVTEDGDDDSCGGVQLWTFYKFATIKGSVTLRWCGESNGYYSVDVDIKRWIEDVHES